MTVEQILHNIYEIYNFNIILADGRFPKSNYLKTLLNKANSLIACDGAVDRLLKHNIKPNYVIGDCDSISNNAFKKLNNIIIKKPNQNLNDLTKAVIFANELHLDNIIILGATGLREDHSIANIALLLNFASLINQIAIISDYGIFTVHNNNEIVKTIKNQQISIFTPIQNTTIDCSELKWPLNKHKFELWNNGTLNEATGEFIIIRTNHPIIVYRAFCIKK